MKKLIMTLIMVTLLMGNQQVNAQSKSVDILASCIVPERLELSLPAQIANPIKEEKITERENASGETNETQFIQKEEVKENSDGSKTVIYTVTSY